MDTSITANLEKQGTDSGHFFGSLLNGLSVNANKSNSFLIASPAQDLFRNVLPNPTGTDKSWGFGLNLFDGKLVIRVTRFDNFQRDSQTSDVNTLAGRVLRMDFMRTSRCRQPHSFPQSLQQRRPLGAIYAIQPGARTKLPAEVQTETKFSPD